MRNSGISFPTQRASLYDQKPVVFVEKVFKPADIDPGRQLSVTKPCLRARITAWVRSPTPSLAKRVLV